MLSFPREPMFSPAVSVPAHLSAFMTQSHAMRMIDSARRGAVLGLLSLAACGDGGAGKGASAPRADSPDVVTESADTSAMATARRILGPEVRSAIPVAFTGTDARFVAAAIPVAERDSAPHPLQVVLLALEGESFSVLKPGLFADTAITMGAEDVTGDGEPELWTAARAKGGPPGALDVSVYDRTIRRLYTIATTSGIDDESRPDIVSSSANLGDAPRVRAWLVNKAEALSGLDAPDDAQAAAP